MTPHSDVIAISGGASGIGLAIARACLAQGWHVSIADSNAAVLAAALGDLGPRAHGSHLDVTDEAAVTAWIAMIEGRGRLAGAVTAAGIGQDIHALDIPLATFRRMHEVNVVGTFLVMREAGRAMANSGGGSLVAIASVAGLRGSKGRIAYGSSKAAVVNMAQTFAVDLAPHGIRANAVCPGPVDTPLVAELHDARTRTQWIAHMPMRRYGTPDEISGLVVFLLDESQSSFLTAQVIAVDGGFSGAGLTRPEG